MRKQNRRVLGVIMVIAVGLVAGAFQLWGHGLIWTDTPMFPPTAVPTATTVMERTNYHVALLPLMIFLVIGIRLAFTAGPTCEPENRK